MKKLLTALLVIIAFASYGQNLNMVLKPFSTPEKPRTQGVNWLYTGTKRLVPSVYTTITAAISAASTGDTILVAPGTYRTARESGGYLLLNDVSKRVLVLGDSTNRGNVNIVTDSVGVTYGVRVRTCNQVTFKNITFSCSVGVVSPTIEGAAASSPATILFNNCYFENTAATSVSTIGIAVPNNINYVEVRNSTIKSNTNASSVAISANTVSDAIEATFPSPLVITGCRIYTTLGLNFFDSALPLTFYDNYVEQTRYNTTWFFGFGSNVTQNVNSTGKLDMRYCVLTCTAGLGTDGHGVLLGRGINNVYFYGNSILMPPSNDVNSIGLVIKSQASSLGNVAIYHNVITAPRPIYIKGGQNCLIKANTTFCNATDATLGYCFEVNNPNNPDGPQSSTGNVVTNNTLAGKNGALNCVTASGATSVATTNLTCTFDRNIYVAQAGLYLISDASTFTFANKSTYWAQDYYSTSTTP